MPKFIPGLRLSELFYKEVVSPILKAEFPNLKYSAGLIGPGSEVLGFDNPLSRDHHWGPRMLLFLSENDYKEKKERIWRVLSKNLPCEFMEYSTNFGEPDKFGVQLLEKTESGPVNHRVDIFTMKSFFKERLDFDSNNEIKVKDWLNFPENELASIVNGKVFHDDLGLKRIRQKFEYYPRDVWLYLLAAQWHEISQEEAFVGRCGDVGDELGSKLITSRIIERVMRLCFLMEKEYAPYSKWFGSAFSRLRSAKKLKPMLNKVLTSETWKEREHHLSKAYEEIAKIHNKLSLTKTMKTKVSKFYNRPYQVIRANTFADEIKKSIKNPELRKRALLGVN